MKGENKVFDTIAVEEFHKRTGLNLLDRVSIHRTTSIVSLRDIVRTLDIRIMPEKYLKSLLFSTVLEGDRSCHIYADCSIQRARIDPHHLEIGQTFIERPKYQKLLEELPRVYEGFCVNHGFAKCNALIVYGQVRDGSFAVAHYVPPIIEIHNDHLFLLDGVHRDFLTMAVGTTIESVLIKGVKTVFPCDPRGWEEVRIVEQKPSRPERFRNLKPHLFRDLKWVGIDG